MQTGEIENFRFPAKSFWSEMMMKEFGKLLLVIGLLIAVLGAFVWAGFGANWFGKLPGDIRYSRGNFSFYFPIATCLLLSLLLTLVLWLFRK